MGRSKGPGSDSDGTKPTGAAQPIAWSARHPSASPRPGNFLKFFEAFGSGLKWFEVFLKRFEGVWKAWAMVFQVLEM
ncbi:MAG: hypothetical protein ABR970_07395 [Roseiarcus sp.]